MKNLEKRINEQVLGKKNERGKLHDIYYLLIPYVGEYFIRNDQNTLLNGTIRTTGVILGIGSIADLNVGLSMLGAFCYLALTASYFKDYFTKNSDN